MSLTAQLPPTDFAALEQVQDRAERDKLLRENWVYRHEEPQGTRYTKGQHPAATKRSWQSLDAVLRSDRNSSDALPYKELRRSRIFAALTAVTGLLFVAAGAATAREGFDFKKANAGNVMMLSSALATVGFAIAAGVFFRRAQRGYAEAVNVYNDSLGVRLGVLSPKGDYVPGENVAVDAEGFILTEDSTTKVQGVVVPGTPVAAPPESTGPAPVGPSPAPVSPAPNPPTSAPNPAPTSAPPPNTTVAPQVADAALEPPGGPRRRVPAPIRTLALLPAR